MALIKGEYNISPDFYNKRIEGYMYIKGRIRSAVVLYYILKIYADKDIKRMAGQIKKPAHNAAEWRILWQTTISSRQR